MQKIMIHNTLSRKLEELKPILDDTVKMYCCGPTVYNYPHIGNLRAYVWEDIVVKTLRKAGYKVGHVQNITDVGHLTSDSDTGEDKMRIAADREKMSVLDIARKYETIFFDYCAKLNIKKPDVVARATEHIPEMIHMIKTLEEKGYAYESGGNVYFDTSKFPNYGKMAGLDLDNLDHGSRVEEDKNKKNPTDFVLWFTDSKFKNQILTWPSPWGEVGYPGWHIECSAMADKYLGEYIDIHCGGVDHIGVHHTNEIAQSESYLGHKWVNIWMHGEFLQIKGGKMSKSAGGFITLDSLIEQGYDPMDFRYFCTTAHYRSALDFTEENFKAAANTYSNLKSKVIELKKNKNGEIEITKSNEYMEKFLSHLYNDFATPQALAVMWEVLKHSELNNATKLHIVLQMDEIFSFGINEMQEISIELTNEIKNIIDERVKARADKNWAKSDELRDKLLNDFGLNIKDIPGGQYELSKR